MLSISESELTPFREAANKYRLEADRNIRDVRSSFEGAMKQTQEMVSEIERTRSEVLLSSHSRLEAFEKELGSAAIKSQNEIQAIQASAQEQINLLRNAQEQLLRIGPMVSHWKDKDVKHATGFFVAAGLFVTMTALAIWEISQNGGEYLSKIPAAPEKSVVATALVIAPIIGYGWVLRLISRFAMQNLSLWDDARQRIALATTYLDLIAQGGTMVTDAERTLALAALFRPVPGQAVADDVAPPTVADLLKAQTQPSR